VTSIRNLLCAALAVGVLLSAPSAEARFGKHSDSSDSSSDNKKTHSASAAGADHSEHHSGSHHHSSSAASFLVDLFISLLVDTSPDVAYVAPEPPPVEDAPVAEAPPRREVRTSSSEPHVQLGLDGAALHTAAGLGAFLRLDGERAGFDARVTGLVAPTDDGSEGTDSITLASFHLTYALVAEKQVRLRIEGGLSTAHAPDLTALAPSAGLSFEAGLVGNLNVELQGQGTLYPYRQVDGQAGLALNMDFLVLRGGWRTVYLNDNGMVDGVEHEDTFQGPYAGLGFSF
jgi:hypothetical protein